jgi:putative DNA primase/helicase
VAGDGERLIGLLVRSGGGGKKNEPGVFHHPRLPGLELRIGGTNQQGKIKQIQSVGAPCLGEDGQARVWFPCRELAHLPERSYRWLEELAKEHYGAKALASEAAAVANKGPGERHDALRDACMRLASLYKSGSITETQAIKQLTESSEANGLVGEGRGEEVIQLWESALPLVGARSLPGIIPLPSRNGVHQAVPPEKAKTSGIPILSRNGRQASCLHNSKIWLMSQNPPMSIRYDRFRQAILVNGGIMSDEMVISLTARIEESLSAVWCQDHIRSALIDIAHANSMSSLTDWLDSLSWDGEERIDSFFKQAYGCDLTAYAGECSRVMFLSGVARAYQPGCQADVMVVLIGPQGLGKSMGLVSLSPDPHWFAEDLGADLSNPKTLDALQGKWLVEFSEFSRINRATLEMVKSFLTRRVDTYVRPYGRSSVSLPRGCIFVGTTNDPHPLRDIENRRFMTIQCKQGDVDWIRRNRDQLWGEAVSRYLRGEHWWVEDSELTQECVAQQEAARMDDAWEEILGDRLKERKTASMTEAAELLSVRPDKLDKSTQVRIGFVLNAIGFKRKRVREEGRRVYLYERDGDGFDPIF